jgi:hypothetical protein
VSFTGVVGYQTTKSSNIARASPLFSVRSSRAIDEESKDIACDYIGKGEETSIPLSSRLKRAEQVQKTANIISKMTDKAFSKFVERVILNLKYQEQMVDKEISDVLQNLYYIRRNPNDARYYDTKDNHLDETVEYLSCRWFPGCYIVFYILVEIVASIIWFITQLFNCYPPTSVAACPTVGCPL